MSDDFDHLPECVWRCLHWFSGPGNDMPEIADVRAAVRAGLVGRKAVDYVLSCAVPPHLPGQDDDDYQLEIWRVATRCNSTKKRELITGRGLLALEWYGQRHGPWPTTTRVYLLPPPSDRAGRPARGTAEEMARHKGNRRRFPQAERTILQAVARAAQRGRLEMTGPEISTGAGLAYDYVRHILPGMCERKHLLKTPGGYRRGPETPPA